MAIGVTANRKIMPNAIGLAILCSNKPNLAHIRLAGAKTLGLAKASKKNANAIKSAHGLNLPPPNSGINAINEKKQVNTRPNERSEAICEGAVRSGAYLFISFILFILVNW